MPDINQTVIKLTPFNGDNSVIPIPFRGYTVESWLEAWRENGSVFNVEIENKEFVAIAGLEANDTAWRSPDDWSYHDSVAVFREELSELHLTQLDRIPHRRKRRLLNPGFKNSSVMRDFPAIGKAISTGLSKIEGRECELHEELMKIFTRAQAVSAVKVDLSDEEIARMVHFEEGFIGALFNTKEEREIIYRRSEYLKIKQTVLGQLADIASERLEDDSIEDSLNAVIHQKAPKGMESLSLEELIYDAYLLLIAGTGNTSKVICFVLDSLKKDPDWLGRLQEELAGFELSQLAGGMEHFPLLKATIMEAERMFPPAAILPRVPFKDLDFLGYELKKGTDCLHAVTLMQFAEEVFEEPFKFKPQRWMENDYPRSALGTFGGGKHTCLGINVARLQMPIALGYLLSQYDYEVLSTPKYENFAFPEGPDSKTVRMNIQLTSKL